MLRQCIFLTQSQVKNDTLGLPLAGRIACLVQHSNGNFLLATGAKIYTMDPISLSLKPFLNLPGDSTLIRFNDGKIDRQGRFWIGTSDIKEKESLGAFYRVDGDHNLYCVDQSFVVSNGPAFSPDGAPALFC